MDNKHNITKKMEKSYIIEANQNYSVFLLLLISSTLGRYLSLINYLNSIEI